MRLRPTALAFLGALALVLPTAGPSLAGGNDDLGRLQYIIDNDERAQIRPSDNDTCYELTDTSRNRPATAVHNGTESRALLYPNHGCGGRVERELQPGDTVYNVEVLSVSFVPTRVRHDDWGDNRRDDWRDDDDDFRSHRTPMDQPEQAQGEQQEQGRQQEHGQDEGQGQGQDQGQEQGRQQEQGQGQEHGQDEGRHQEHHKGGHDLFDSIFHGRG